MLREWDLPAPLPGAEWGLDTKFNAAEELLKDPRLKATIAAVLKNGVEIAGTIEVKVKQKPSVGLPDKTLDRRCRPTETNPKCPRIKWHQDCRRASKNRR